ncbi:MAG: PepSY-associated TM helix domain-containing protein [Pseudomonadota bacterium]|nr:PepSY-associated TM helix domain-containing protein [Pseudomonadota bacterium]
MRNFWLSMHRYLGLGMTLFLVVTGITGAIISWDHELDEWLNPHLNETSSAGTPKSPIELAQHVEKMFPHIEVTYFELHHEPGHSQYFWVEPRVNPNTGRLYDTDFNQVYVDPINGSVLGKREWGQVWPITRETFMSFLYKLHFSFHIPEFWDFEHWGILLLGVVALIWTLDCFIGLYLTLPRKRARKTQSSWWQRWKPAWKIATQKGSARLNFDLHRAFGLWTWVLLLTLAFTAFSLNLYRDVFFPLMSLVSDVTPSPLDLRTPNDHHDPITPSLTFSDIAKQSQAVAQQRQWQEPLGSLWYAREYGLYRVEYFTAAAGHGSGGVGHKALYFDGNSGEYLGDFIPWRGTAADLFVQAQFPVHSGRILGLPGRILISAMGLIVAMLSITGLIIWMRKTKRKRQAQHS